MSYPKRNEIWLVCFEPQVGTEIKKTRPALIISNDYNNKGNTKVTIIAITGAKDDKAPPLAVKIDANDENNLKKDSYIKVPDMTTFDKSRLKHKIGIIDKKTQEKVDKLILKHLNF